jgi:hypothetical protein
LALSHAIITPPVHRFILNSRNVDARCAVVRSQLSAQARAVHVSTPEYAEIKAIEPDIEQVSCCNVFRDINTVVVICICRRWNSERRFCVSCSSKEYTRVEHKAIRQERAKHALVVGRAKRVDLRRAFSCLVGLSINAGLFKGVVSVQFD